MYKLMYVLYMCQEHRRAWLHDPMNKLDGEAVEKEVASNVRTMHKTGKAFAQRGLQAYATNCNSVKGEIEEFQKVVPLLVVRSCNFRIACCPIACQTTRSKNVPDSVRSACHPSFCRSLCSGSLRRFPVEP